jgi:hypothetical protein
MRKGGMASPSRAGTQSACNPPTVRPSWTQDTSGRATFVGHVSEMSPLQYCFPWMREYGVLPVFSRNDILVANARADECMLWSVAVVGS